MMNSIDHRGGGTARPSPLSSRREEGGVRPQMVPNSSLSALNYTSPSELPYLYPKSSPSTVQVFPLYSDSSGAQYYHDTHKRGRIDVPPPSATSDSVASAAGTSYPIIENSQQSQLQSPPTDAPIPEVHQAAKRSRLATYTPPRQVPKNTFLATMGSLAVAAASVPPSSAGIGAATSNNGSVARVPIRRQLSGSKLEGFLGNHDSMEVDESADGTRPRSMSF
jgi:hypothetical protein